MNIFPKSALFPTLLAYFAACDDHNAEPNAPTLNLLVKQAPGETPAPTAAPNTVAEPTLSGDKDQVLTLLYWQVPTLPNPYQSASIEDRDTGAITLEPLARHDPDGNLAPTLTADIPTIDHGGFSADLMSISWALKNGLKWSDGSAVSAADMAFTWHYCVDPRTGCVRTNAFDGVAAVPALDGLTVRIAFGHPTPHPYGAFVGAGTPVISQAQFADCIGDAAANCGAENIAPLGTGPYRIVAFLPGERAGYERNPHFRRATPHFDKVILKGGGEALATARAVLEAGQADYAWNLHIEPETLRELEAAGHGKVVSALSSPVERIVVNQANSDPDLRDNRSEYLDGGNPHPFLTFTPVPQAMSIAVDRSLLADRFHGFAGEPACNLVVGPPGYASGSNKSCLSQDIIGARKLLDDHGAVDNDGDGIREYNGVPLRVTVLNFTNSIRQETQALIRDWWGDIGVSVEVLHHDAGVFFGGDPVADKAASYRRFYADILMYSQGPTIDPQQYLAEYLCQEIPTPQDHWAGNNVARACNPEYDQLYDQLAETEVGPARPALGRRLDDIIVENYYEIPLVNRGAVSAYSNALKGVPMNG